MNGSLLGCLRKDVALCHTVSRAWGRGNGGRGDGVWVDCAFHGASFC
ncbi:hypothetical protein [Desulfosporosinus sp. BG]|nr:hypothetical protein [Desulfosporosinus sp. BG]